MDNNREKIEQLLKQIEEKKALLKKYEKKEKKLIEEIDELISKASKLVKK